MSASLHRPSKAMKYRYSVVAGATNIDGRYTKRPVVEVVISRGNVKRTVLALLDSGADHIMMPTAIAEAIGIERDRSPRRTTMGVTMEPIDGFVSHLTLQIAHQDDAFDAPVVFIDAEVPVLMGREGFFDRYRIKFEQDHDTFEITPAPLK
jgi:hypothetical protein